MYFVDFILRSRFSALVIIFSVLFNHINCIPIENEAENQEIVAEPIVENENIEETVVKDTDINDTDNLNEESEVVENTEVENTEVKNTEVENTDLENTNVIEDNDFAIKEPISLLPEQQSNNDAAVQNTEVDHHRTLGGIGSIFGGFGRTIGNSIVGNAASLNQRPGATDASVERAEKLTKGFEKMIQFVNIVGQVDSFLTDRTKSVMRRLAMLAEDEDDMPRRSGYHRRHYYKR